MFLYPQKENTAEKNEEMSSAPAVATAPAAAPVDDKEHTFTYMLENYNNIDTAKVYSPWQTFAGFQWRLLIFPKGNQTKSELSVYLECGGPVIPEASDKRAVTDTAMDHSLARHSASSHVGSIPWTRAAHFWLHLIHPTRWPTVGVPNPYETESEEASATGPTGPVSPTGRANYANAQAPAVESPTHRPHMTQDIVRDTLHIFKERESDWGFLEFAPFIMLRPGKHADDHYNLLIKVRIRLEECYADALPNSAIQYDSRKETGYVGFKNQGATCYMNSLLQTLYMLNAFRRAVYEMPLSDLTSESSESDMSYALQKVFYELQFSPSVVKTKKLTESFGWESTDAFTQHDVQELNRILCDHLEEKMKKMTDGENTISQLFQGKFLNYIQCINVEYKSTREESFYDLSLNVKGCRNIMESFRKYTEVEVMDGDNKYRADGFEELQEARKGANFLALPPVLQLHLKRFEYDYARDSLVKINDRYEFDTEIDLSQFVEGSEPGTDVYLLHSVLVHIGDVNGGHYHAFIRPHLEKGEGQDPDKWLMFDDESVKVVNEREAVNNNFGFGGEKDLMNMNNGVKRGKLEMDDDISNIGGLNGQTHPTTLTPKRNQQSQRFTNAYMLQYIRKSEVSTLLKPCTREDIPQQLSDRITKEREQDELRKKERLEQHLYMVIAVATYHDLSHHYGADLVDWDKVKTVRVLRTMKVGELKQLLKAENLCSDPALVRLWKCTRRQNDTIRPNVLVSDGDDNRPISDSAPRDLLQNAYNTSVYNTRHFETYAEDPFKIFVEDFHSRRCYSPGRSVREVRLREKEAEKERVQKLLSTATANPPVSETPTPTENGVATDVKTKTEAKETEEPKTMEEDDIGVTTDTGEMQDEVAPNPRSQVFETGKYPLHVDEILLFFKVYIANPTPALHWLGYAVVDKSLAVAELLSSLQQDLAAAGVPSPDRLTVFEELSVGSVADLQPDLSLKALNVNGGDIIVFQPPLPQALAEHVASRNSGETFSQDGLLNWDFHQTVYRDDGRDLPLGGRPLPTVRDYYSFLAFRFKVEFKNKWSFNDFEDPPGIWLELLRRDSYLTVRKVLASVLGNGADADYLRLFPHDSTRQGPAHDAVKIADNDELLKIPPIYTLSSHLLSSHLHRMDYRILWYEVTEYPLTEFEQKEEIRIYWRGATGPKVSTPVPTVTATAKASPNGPNGPLPIRDPNDTSTTSEEVSLDETGTDTPSVADKEANSPIATPMATSPVASEEMNVSFSVLVPQMSKYQDVITEIKKRQRLEATLPVRLLEVKNNRIYRIVEPQETIPHMMSAYDCRAELRAEPIPAAETAEALGDDTKLVGVVHMAKERHRSARLSFFGDPFVIPVKCDGDTVQDIRERIRVKLGVAEQEFSQWRLAEINHHKVEYLDDSAIMWNAGMRNSAMDYCTLAIEHRSPTPTRRANAGGRFADKPLKIRG